jgi:hypothetical protein
MTWSAPMTAVAGSIFSAAQFNQYVRDNLNETAPAKASADGQVFVATGANAIDVRVPASARVNTSETTTATSYGDLATVGPSVTCTTGAHALVIVTADMDNNSDNAASSASFAITGASSIAAADSHRIARDGHPASNIVRYSAASFFNTLVPGSNIFTMKYLVGSGTGTFANREIFVFPM